MHGLVYQNFEQDLLKLISMSYNLFSAVIDRNDDSLQMLMTNKSIPNYLLNKVISEFVLSQFTIKLG